jgi:hypothetical protein
LARCSSRDHPLSWRVQRSRLFSGLNAFNGHFNKAMSFSRGNSHPMIWKARHKSLSDAPTRPIRRRWTVIRLLLWGLILMIQTLACEGGQVLNQAGQPKDPCQSSIRQSATQLRQLLDFRLMRGFPLTAQLDEGNARLSPLSILAVDCEQQRVVVSGSYEFRGNLGVMDITRRGTTVLQLRLSPKPGQGQVWLEEPEVLEVTFDNPAPWFDGKAISNWALSLFAKPVCVNLQNGQPC